MSLLMSSLRRGVPLARAFTQVPKLGRRTGTVGRFVSRPLSSNSEVASGAEDELNKALSEILGEDYKTPVARNPVGLSALEVETGDAEVDEVEVDDAEVDDVAEVGAVTDPKSPMFLSTSNPHWETLGFPSSIRDILSEKGISKFTPVQGEAFEPLVNGRDIIGRSRTGTGKTLAFGLPSIIRLEKRMRESGIKDAQGRMKRGRGPSMLVLCPTRELARQVGEELASVSKPLGLFVDVFHGGVSYDGQSRALYRGIDVLVGTPGRIIDHKDRGNLDMSGCQIVVLDEADEMLNMGFADDVEVILEGVGSKNEEKTQCCLFSATTPPWVKEIGRSYQDKDVLFIDSTADVGGARTATTVRHLAVQCSHGMEGRKQILEDIIAVEICKDRDDIDEEDDCEHMDDIAKAAKDKKSKTLSAMQQKIFGKTIVFTETKVLADDLVSGGVFKSLTAQTIHGDVGQKQRDSTLKAFRQGAFNVLIATDVAARGIDIQDVDLVVQFAPPKNVDTYVHRSGRTGRAGKKGTSVLLFSPNEARGLVNIERGLGHGFKFNLVGPPSIAAALDAAAKTSAMACMSIPDDTASYFKEAAANLLEGESAQDVVARCLAAVSRRAAAVQSRSLLTGEIGYATVEMTNTQGRAVSPNDVLFTVSKLSRMSSKDERDISFDSDLGKIQSNFETGTAFFDMSVEDATNLIAFSQDIDAGGNTFQIIKEMDISRGRNFGRERSSSGGRQGNFRGGNNRNQGGRGGNSNRYQGRSGGSGGYSGRSSYQGGGRSGGGGGGGGGRSSYQGGGRSNGYQDRGRGNQDGYRGGQGRGKTSQGRQQGGDDGW